jgi:hypothetical protein
VSHQDATGLAWYFDFVLPCSRLQFKVDRDLIHGAGLRPMLFEYLAGPSVFDEANMRRTAALPVGAARKS